MTTPIDVLTTLLLISAVGVLVGAIVRAIFQ